MEGILSEDLRVLNAQGWILAPDETKESLLFRKSLSEKKKDENTIEKEVHDLTESLYGFRLENAQIIYSNNSLLPWQGALLWTYFTEEGTPFPVIQMRESYRKKIFCLYDPKEILAHELLHAARFAFKEPLFEEVFAYKTSKSWFRRFFGPLFIFPIEPTIFILLSVIGSLGFVFFDCYFCFWTPFLFLIYLFLRLLLIQSLFCLAENRLKKTGVLHSIVPFMVRLSDWEIIKFAFSSNKSINRTFCLKRKEGSIRYKEVFPFYFK